MRMIALTVTASLLFVSTSALASAVDERLGDYKRQGASGFSAERGAALWAKESDDAKGRSRSCASCHGADLSKGGKHIETGKHIEPMLPSVNPKRLTDPKFIEKWFARNCKSTFGRECTAQEKGDFLMFINR